LSLEIASLFEKFLTALGDPEAGEILYELHAPDAIVRCGQGIGPAATIERHTFAMVHRELGSQAPEARPRFSHSKLLRFAADSNLNEAVAWFEITEDRERRSLIAALGIRTIDGAQRIGWATLSSRIEAWSYRDGLLQSLADYAWMRTTVPARARALLEASYFRRHSRPEVKFTTLPDARFQCQMSTVCCKHDFEITLPAEAQLVIDAIPWKTLRPALSETRLPARPDGTLQLKALNESCRFLGELGQCLIHQAIGRQPFGPCCIFPVAFAKTPDGIAVGLSPICDAARRGIGPALSDREDDLRERLAHAEPRQAEAFRLAPAAVISWEHFRDVENALCEILAWREIPMRRRLYVGSRLLGALKDNQAVSMDRWLAEPTVEITAELREALHGMLAKILGWDRGVLRALPQTVPEGLGRMEVQEPEIVSQILRNTLFCKIYSFSSDLTTAYNFLIVLYLLALLMQAATLGPLTDAMWRELGSLGVHGLLKSVFHEGVPDGFRSVFGTAEFGLWLLAA